MAYRIYLEFNKPLNFLGVELISWVELFDRLDDG